jgi:hypothetical protein
VRNASNTSLRRSPRVLRSGYPFLLGSRSTTVRTYAKISGPSSVRTAPGSPRSCASWSATSRPCRRCYLTSKKAGPGVQGAVTRLRSRISVASARSTERPAR